MLTLFTYYTNRFEIRKDGWTIPDHRQYYQLTITTNPLGLINHGKDYIAFKNIFYSHSVLSGGFYRLFFLTFNFLL